MRVSASGIPTRASLVVRLHNPDDREAWEQFARVYGPFIFRMCRRAGLGETEAADATQNVFVRVLKYARRLDYRPERGKFRGWLGTLARNEVATAWGLARRDEELARGAAGRAARSVCWEDGAWEEEFAVYIHRVALEQVRRQTTKRSWVIFKLTWLVGCPAAEVARRLRLPIARVFEAKCRTLRRYREQVTLLAEGAAELVPAKLP